MAGQVLAVASGKGGVGKTTTVVNLGVVLRRADHTVALVDADLGMANLGTMLGVSVEVTLHDVLSGSSSVEEALVEEAPGFGVLVGSGDLTAYPDAAPEGLGDVLDALAGSYDYVLVDTGAGMSHEDVLPLGITDRVVLVTSPDPAAVGDTQKTAELADLAHGTILGLVITMADDSTDAAEIASQVGADLLGVIPFDPAVRSSTASATPLEAADPEGAAASAYRELATVLTAELGSPTEAAAVEDAIADASDAAADPGPPADDEEAGDGAEPNDDASVEAEEADDEPAVSEGSTDEEPSDGDDEAPSGDEEPAEIDEGAAESAPDEPDDEADEDREEPAEIDEDAAESAPDEPDDEADEDREDAAAETADESAEDEDLDDYLEEFEDAEPAPSGGLFAKLRRLFR